METDRLKQFCTIVETGSFSKAASLLGISHSGLSKSMKLLEQELQKRLFLPNGRGISISDAGTEVYKNALPILRDIGRLLQPHSKNQPRSLIRIGALEIFTVHLLGALAANKLADLPIEFHEMDPGTLETALRQRRIDFGLTFVPVPQDGLEHIEIARTKMKIYVQQNSFTDVRVQDLPFVVPMSLLGENPLGVKERDGWNDSIFQRKILYRTNLLSTALDLTRRGLCAVYIPEFVAHLHNRSSDQKGRLEPRSLTSTHSKSERTLYLVKRLSTEEDAICKKIVSGVRAASHF